MPQRPSAILTQYRAFIIETAQRYRVANPRVFGSVLFGRDQEGSDLDILIDPLPHTTLFDLGGLQDELESALGIPVDVLTPKDLPDSFRQIVLDQAQPL